MNNDYRPRLAGTIREQLEQEIDGEELYKLAGYSSKVSFIDQSIKEKIEREKEQLNKNND